MAGKTDIGKAECALFTAWAPYLLHFIALASREGNVGVNLPFPGDGAFMDDFPGEDALLCQLSATIDNFCALELCGLLQLEQGVLQPYAPDLPLLHQIAQQEQEYLLIGCQNRSFQETEGEGSLLFIGMDACRCACQAVGKILFPVGKGSAHSHNPSFILM
jgi:hypothetical protein